MRVLVLCAVLLAGCHTPSPWTPDAPADLQMISSFNEGRNLPPAFVCPDGPSLLVAFGTPPRPAQTYAAVLLLGDDVHWLFYDLPDENRSVEPGMDPRERGATAGVAYRVPCPEADAGLRLWGFAVDTRLGLDEGASWPQVRDAMDGHIVAWASINGTATW